MDSHDEKEKHRITHSRHVWIINPWLDDERTNRIDDNDSVLMNASYRSHQVVAVCPSSQVLAVSGLKWRLR